MQLQGILIRRRRQKKVMIMFENFNQQFVVDLEQPSTRVDYCLIESDKLDAKTQFVSDHKVCSSETPSVVWRDCTNKSLQGRVPATYGPARQVFCFTLYCYRGYWQRRPKAKERTDAIRCRWSLHCKPSLCCYRYSNCFVQ